MVWEERQTLYGRRYTVERKLGEGGFGITYLAKERKGKQVVIKALKDEVLTNPDYADFRDKYERDFEREATRLAVCRHPHIVQIENVFHEGALPCIAMEYIEGENFWRFVKSRGILSETEALRYIKQIGDALTVVHDKGLLHRDLKPHNIMLRSNVSEAVLIDFGIAREFIPDITQTHSFHGTHGFTPIEQYDERARRGEFTDVYALAATLYFLLTAKSPPPAFTRNVRDSLIPPKQINQSISDRVNQAILSGITLQPENRPQSVQAWLEELLDSREETKAESRLQVFEFDVVTVNAKGEIINRRGSQAEYFTEDLGNEVTLDMVAIPGGKFMMGSPEGEGNDRERPQHEVTVQPFFMGKYPVTQAQWKAIAYLPKVERDLNPEPAYFKGDKRPVELVSWYDAVEFCERLSRKTGKEYRLPSEAEWEYACRAETTTPFHFGKTIFTNLANYNGDYTYADAPKGKYRGETTPVGTFPPNAFGLYDMHGNVWEWCADTWHENYERAPTDGSAWTNGGNDNRSPLRGGSWYNKPGSCRSAFRNYDLFRMRVNVNIRIGFRVACAIRRT